MTTPSPEALIGPLSLFLHAGSGVLAILAALWVFKGALNAREGNAARIQTAAWAVAFFMGAAWICGGYWYVHFYPADKAMILKGSWPFAHTLFMETKEHLFFVALLLAFYLPIVVREKLYANEAARKLALCVSLLIILSGLAIEGAGAVISYGVRVAYLHPAAKVTHP